MNDCIKTVTEQIYNVIRQDILSQRLKPGEKLTTKTLQEKLGVSSTPIREALTRLQQDGLIEYQPNVGMRVVRLTRKDLEDIFSLMIEFDVIAMKFSCRSSKRADMVDTLRRVQEEAAVRLENAELERWETLSDDFHLVFYRFADNSRLNIAAERTRMQFTIYSNAYQSDETNRREIQREHDQILHYLEAGDDETAEAALRRHSAASFDKALEVLNARG